jgi:hypothetical protein
MKAMLTLLACLLVAAQAFAHGPGRGPNGGTQVDAGDYHVEMVAKGTVLDLYLHDENDKPVDVKGGKGTGVLLVDGKPQRIELSADTADRLTGSSSVPLPASPKGAVQITLPTGRTVQVKFE